MLSRTHLLHLADRVLVRGQLAVETEELLLLLRQLLQRVSAFKSPMYAWDARKGIRGRLERDGDTDADVNLVALSGEHGVGVGGERASDWRSGIVPGEHKSQINPV